MPPVPPNPTPLHRLKVLVVVTRGEPGGAQIHVLELLRGLRDRVDFHLVLGDDEFLAQEARALGLPVTVVPSLQRAVSPATDVRALRDLRGLVRVVAPDLVHTHSTKAGLLGRAAARIAGVPAIHTAHAWSFSDGIAWRRKAYAIPMEAVAGRVTARFIVVSEADREVGMRFGVARDNQIRVVHNGVADVPERGLPEIQPPVFTMVARMADPKDHDLLLRAFAGVKAPCTLCFVGDGPDREAVEARVDALGLRDRVSLLGVRRDVAALLADAQAAVLISRQEGFPLVVLEGMRAGLPVVASDVGGVREAVTHGRTGFLVPRGDEAGLRDALERLAADPALRARMGAAGRKVWEERFTVDTMVAATAKVYAEVAAEARVIAGGAA